MDEPFDDPEASAALEELRAVLRQSLQNVGPGLRTIREQLARAAADLRAGAEASSLPVAVENLISLFSLLDQMNQSVGEQSLPALDAFHAAVERFIAVLERELENEPRMAAVADSLETDLLPAMDRWPEVEAELSVAAEKAVPVSDGSDY